jgi:hypothetical protein
METAEELKKWIESLTVAEKRFIKLLGKARAGANTSQQLELFDWLNQARANETFPPRAKFLQNLPTVSNRLKDLILDGLRMLHKEDNTDALLRTTLDEIAMLHEKKLYRAASKQLKRAKKLALDTSRYGFALQCIEGEQKIVQVMSASDMMNTLKELREEETDILKKWTELKELQYRHDLTLVVMRQFFFHRDARTLKEVQDLCENEMVYRLSEEGNYPEQALAINLLGMKSFFERNPLAALAPYQKLLAKWTTQPAWQIDQFALLLLICKMYQLVCFHCAIDWEEARKYLNVVSDFKGLSPDANREFLLMLYENQFILALNTGKFDAVEAQILEIEKWLDQEAKHLSEVRILPSLCNFAVAEFLGENFASANKIVTRILNMPNRNARKDIREFALVLQAVLQFELGNTELNEYLTRSGKRHFSKNSFEINFELIVFKYLETAMHKESKKKAKEMLQKLIEELDNLAEQLKDSIPLLGLNEIRMWAKSKQTGESLREIFLQEVRKNLEELEQTELL